MVERAAADAGALVLDLRRFGARNLLMADHVHPTAFGQISIAERALDLLQRDGLPAAVRPSELISYETTRWKRLRGDATYAYRTRRSSAGLRCSGAYATDQSAAAGGPPPRWPPAAAAPARASARPARAASATRRRSPAGSSAPRCRGRARPAPGPSPRARARRSARRISAHQGRRSRIPRRASSALDQRAPRRIERLAPAAHRVVVVRAGVDDALLDVVLEAVRRVRLVGLEGRTAAPACPGSPSESRRRSTAGVITPRSSATSGSAAELPPGGVERRAPGAAPPATRARRRARPRARPSRRRSRGSGRSARGRRARRCAAAARPTSGSRGAAAPASRRAGCPRAGPCRCRRPGGAPATTPSRNSSGCARWSALSGAT